MFKFDPKEKNERRVMYPVTVQINDEQGEPAPVTFKMGFILLDRPAYQAWFRRDFSQEARPKQDEETKQNDQPADSVDALFAGFREALNEDGLALRDAEIRKHCYAWNIVDPDNKSLPFTDANLKAVMDQGTAWALAVENAWLDACRDAPVKNS